MKSRLGRKTRAQELGGTADSARGKLCCLQPGSWKALARHLRLFRISSFPGFTQNPGLQALALQASRWATPAPGPPPLSPLTPGLLSDSCLEWCLSWPSCHGLGLGSLGKHVKYRQGILSSEHTRDLNGAKSQLWTSPWGVQAQLCSDFQERLKRGPWWSLEHEETSDHRDRRKWPAVTLASPASFPGDD